jgi:hypothetical protein
MTFETLVYIIVLVNLTLTIELWRRAARRPEKLKRKFLNQLWRTKPIMPKHQPAPPLEAGMGVKKDPAKFSSDFEVFANVINCYLIDRAPWRLQELPTIELSNLARLAPAYGRRYAVFHNQARVGEIEIKPDYYYSTEAPDVTIHIELNWVRLLPFETIRGFLTDVAMNTFEYERGSLEYFQMYQKIDLAMMDVLWKTQEISQFGMDDEPSHGQITVQLEGSANSYLEGRRIFRNQAVKAGQRE